MWKEIKNRIELIYNGISINPHCWIRLVYSLDDDGKTLSVITIKLANEKKRTPYLKCVK